MTLTFPFWNDLKNAQISERLAIANKYKLTPSDRQIAASIIGTGKLEEEWFSCLYKECLSRGLLKASSVFDKYQIKEEEREELTEKIYKRWTDGVNRGKFNN